ncbi:hypothetical protein ACOSQ2_011733 [Xanthoceras sorbifolium]
MPPRRRTRGQESSTDTPPPSQPINEQVVNLLEAVMRMYATQTVHVKDKNERLRDFCRKFDTHKLAHKSKFVVYSGSTKMYHDLKRQYWWTGMKREVAEFVAKCMVCQQVKAEHQQPSGLLQPLPIPEWKWDKISMDFVTGLPLTSQRHDAIWVIVDRLSSGLLATTAFPL